MREGGGTSNVCDAIDGRTEAAPYVRRPLSVLDARRPGAFCVVRLPGLRGLLLRELLEEFLRAPVQLFR